MTEPKKVQDKAKLNPDILKKLMEQDSAYNLTAIHMAMINRAVEGDTTAANILYNRYFGAVKQQVEVSGDQINPITVLVTDTNELLKNLRKRADEVDTGEDNGKEE